LHPAERRHSESTALCIIAKLTKSASGVTPCGNKIGDGGWVSFFALLAHLQALAEGIPLM
jgi:hypothetical protein